MTDHPTTQAGRIFAPGEDHPPFARPAAAALRSMREALKQHEEWLASVSEKLTEKQRLEMANQLCSLREEMMELQASVYEASGFPSPLVVQWPPAPPLGDVSCSGATGEAPAKPSVSITGEGE